jgi:flavodoxin
MSTIVVFYSYGGSTKTLAGDFAAKESADIAEVKDVNRPGKLKAYTAGIAAAIRGRARPIQPLGADLQKYDRLVLFAPIWAGNPPPAFNALLSILPSGKKVSVKMVSMSGKSNCKERLTAVIKAQGCELENFEDIKVK